MPVTQTALPHSQAWLGFTYLSFGTAVLMLGIGIFYLPLDWASRAYLVMGMVMLIQSCVTLTKTVRDQHEAARLVNRIEDARTERLLMEVGKAAA